MGHGGVSSTTAAVHVNDLNGGADPLVPNLDCVLTFFPMDSAGPADSRASRGPFSGGSRDSRLS
jgi:hypothetical protein